MESFLTLNENTRGETGEEMISVGILAYNHAHFMERVLNGVFSQKTDFPFKVYINDDCSSDGTAGIIKQFQALYPGRIVLFENEMNKGPFHGAMRIFDAVQGKYLTMCDGDDYWISDQKLQEQVDFLEANPGFIASCHDALIEADNTQAHGQENPIARLQTKKQYKTVSQFTTYRGDAIENWELLNGITYIQNCTLIWRRFDLEPYRTLFSSVKFNLDWLFSVVLSTQGKIQYINEPWAVYSDHSGGQTKQKYFFDCYFDKIKTLHQLKKMDFFSSVLNKRHIYYLLTKQYNDLLEGSSGGKKTKRLILKWIVLYTYYSMISTVIHTRYFFKQRREMLGR